MDDLTVSPAKTHEQEVASSLHQIAKSLKKIEVHLSVMLAGAHAKDEHHGEKYPTV